MKSQFISAGFPWLLLVPACLVVILFGLNKAVHKAGFTTSKRKKIVSVTAVVMGLWVAALSVLSLNGFFADFTSLPPRPVLALLLPLPFVLLFAFSKTGARILRTIPPYWLVLIQSFRIVVEIFLWLAFIKNLLPIQMSFEGRNWDVFSGLLALPAAYLIKKHWHSRAITLVINIVGILLLLNILTISVLSMPTPIRYFMNEPSNIIVAEFPFILLPGVLVPIAYSFHIFSLRQAYLVRREKEMS